MTEKNMTHYDVLLADMEKKIKLLEGQIVNLTKRRDGLITEINKEIYATKEKTDKLIAKAEAEAEKIIVTAKEIEVRANEKNNDVSLREINVEERKRNADAVDKKLDSERKNLTKDQADFAELCKTKLISISTALNIIKEIAELSASYGQNINTKIREIEQLK